MKKLSLKNSDNLTVDEAFEDFKGHCRIKNLSGETIKLVPMSSATQTLPENRAQVRDAHMLPAAWRVYAQRSKCAELLPGFYFHTYQYQFNVFHRFLDDGTYIK